MGKFKIMIVNCDVLNVRSGPGTSHRIVSQVRVNEQYTSSKQQNGWYYIDAKGGWSIETYIKLLQNLDPQPPSQYKPPTNGKALNVGNVVTIKTTATNYAEGAAIDKALLGTRHKILEVKEWVLGRSKRAYRLEGVPGWVLEQDISESGVSNGIPDYSEIDKILNNSGKSTEDRIQDLTYQDLGAKQATSTTEQLTEIDPSKLESAFAEDDMFVSDYTLDYEFVEANLNIIRKNYNIIGETPHIRDDLFTRFNRFKLAFPQHHLTKTFSYVFFTRPSLNLMAKGALHPQFENDSQMYHFWHSNPNVVRSLTDNLSASHSFHPYLSNSALSFDVPDEIIKTVEHGETFTGYKLVYGRHNIESNTAGQFTIQFIDDNEYSVYKTHKLWTEYISRVYRGTARPTKLNIKNKILDYASSVYYFICAEDGETILFWAKYFGVFPLNTPASASSWGKGSTGAGSPSFGINYMYAMKEDFSPLTLSEFNMNSNGSYIYRRIYDPVVTGTGRTLSGAPFVQSIKQEDGSHLYKLKFRD